MGQYHVIVNLDKKQCLDPHRLGAGLKLWEQLANNTPGQALIVLLASASNGQGGGDLAGGGAGSVIGSWRGDRIAMVGDYDGASTYDVGPKGERMSGEAIYDAALGDEPSFEDVTDAVCAVLERELNVRFEGEGWRAVVPLDR